MKIKRLLSIILALSMVFSLMPTLSVSAEMGDTLSYVFTKYAVNSYYEDGNAPLITAITSADMLYRDVSTGAWCYDASSQKLQSTVMGTNSGEFSVSASNAVLGQNALVLKITVDEPGDYIPVFNHATHALSQTKIDLFLASEAEYTNLGGAIAAMSDSLTNPDSKVMHVISGVDNYSTAKSEQRRVQGDPVSLSDSTYYLMISADGYGEKVHVGRHWAEIYSFELKKTKILTLTDIEADFGSVFISDRLTDPKVTWLSGDEEITDAHEYNPTVEWEVTDNSDGALTKDENGKWVAVKEGDVTVKVEGTFRGVTKDCNVLFHITEDTELSGVNQAYMFTTNVYSDTTTNPKFEAPVPITEAAFKEKFIYQDYGEERPWGVIAFTASRSVGSYFSSSQHYMDYYGESNDWLAVKVKVPAPGKYGIDVSGYKYSRGGLGEIYMLPYNETMDWSDLYANVKSYMTKDNLVAEVDLYDTKVGVTRFENVGEFTADASLDYSKGWADYLMIINSAQRTTKNILLLSGIYFKGEKGVHSAETVVSDDLIGIGEQVSALSTTAKYSNNEPIDLSDAYIWYSVAEDSTDVLKLNDDGKSVTAIAEGKGKLLTHIAFNGKVTILENEITVDDSERVVGAYLYPVGGAMVDNDMSFIIGAELCSGNMLKIGSVARYIITEESEPGVVKVDKTGKILTGAKEGTVKLKVVANIRGNEYETDEVTLYVAPADSVYPATFTIDFRKEVYEGDNFEALSEIVKYSKARNWIYHAFVGSYDGNAHVRIIKFNETSATFTFKTSGNRYAAFKVKFPQSGNYSLDIIAGGIHRCAEFEAYLFPATDENGNDLWSLLKKDNEHYIGSVNFYTPEYIPTGLEYHFGETNITEPGEYFVVFKIADGSGKDVWYPRTITFTNKDATYSASLSAKDNDTTLEIGDTAELLPAVHKFDGSVIEGGIETAQKITYTSSDENVATVSQEGIVTGVNEGTATITATVVRDGMTVSAGCDIKVEDNSGIDESYGIITSLSKEDSIYVYAQTKISLSIMMNSGKNIAIPSEYITWNVTEGAEFVSVSEDGTVTGEKVGKAIITPEIDPAFKTGMEELSVAPVTINVEWDATVDLTIFTSEERENVQKNAAKYDWAKKSVESTAKAADKYVENLDILLASVVPEGLPRFYHAGHYYDPHKNYCRYCGVDIAMDYGVYGWVCNPLTRPWKVQCPDCKRLFPSNEFEKFYELGLTESKNLWDYKLALQRHHEMFVCEHVKAGQECTHIRPMDSAPEPGSTAWQKNDPRTAEWKEFYGYDVPGGYLTNDLYKEADEKLGIKGWGVDDGYGYHQPYITKEKAEAAGFSAMYHATYEADENGFAWYTNGPVQHNFIAWYLHRGLWVEGQPLRSGLGILRDAFLYTGDIKYGRAGAILLDRVADAYPYYEWYRWATFRGNNYNGGIGDPGDETHLTRLFAECYDAFKPVYNDPYVTEYISSRTPQYEMNDDGSWKRDENGELIPKNLKDSPGALRKHIEDNMLLNTFKRAKRGEVLANFGTHQASVTAAAVALNRLPETKEMLDWVFRTTEKFYNTNGYQGEIEGGYVMETLIGDVDRDGHGNESAPGYNRKWVRNLMWISDYLNGYELYPAFDLTKNPKFTKMFAAPIRLTLGGYYGAQIGDSGASASRGIVMEQDSVVTGFQMFGDPLLAQALYAVNGNSTAGYYGSLFAEDAEVANAIQKAVDEYGEIAFETDMMAGYGFAALRAGAKYDSASSTGKTNTIRDFAIYFGTTSGHTHYDTLNLFASAFGLNIAPDLGYPEQTGADGKRRQWISTTLSHNTVVVNEEPSLKQNTGTTPLHFDDSGRVKLMDITSPNTYEETDEYRRSVIMVEVDDENSYGIDFFHVKGGEDHLYSFHSQSDELTAISGLSDMEETPMYTDEKGNLRGTYAGKDVVFGDDPGGNAPNNTYPLGYTWLKNVRTFNSIDKEFTVEYKVKDWNKILPDNPDIRLRMTMLNDEPLSEVTFAKGDPVQNSTNANIGELEYLLVRNKGKNLDTMFTTVMEPYKAGNKYVKSIEKVSMERKAGSKPGLSDAFSAVKVTLENGRVDYVIYATNTEMDYIVDNKINFRGFAGVMSLEMVDGNETLLYSYLNDGEVLKLISDTEAKESLAAYTGEITAYTDDLVMENSITFKPTEGMTVDIDEITGKWLYVDNDGIQNGAYKIEDAWTDEQSGNIVLDLGDVSLVRGVVDLKDLSKGYTFNVALGDKLRIPRVVSHDSSPVFEPISDATVTAKSSITIPIKVESPVGKDITLIGTTLPRGMTLDAEQMTLTWKPTSSQIGENHVAITADDGTLSKTLHFSVMVYGATTGSSSQDEDNTGSVDSTDTPSGGATPAPEKDTNNDVSSETGDVSGDDVGNITDAENENLRFVDLGEYAWAADSINSLTDEGIIKGTTENTYSPALNITRADFALLLVRAFKLESDNTENFADVAESDYFARELAIARNCGIVGGIGDNKYAPRNTITRQDMMVIVYRALKALGVELVTGKVDYPDFDKVAPYARDAVEALITSGLVNGKNNMIAPTDYTTRAEVAVLLKRILAHTDN